MGLCFTILMSVVLLSIRVVDAAKPVTLATNGAASAVIVVDPGATEAEQFAAQDLKIHLDQMTGGNFQIVNPTYKTTQARILIGQCPEVKGLLPNIDFDNMQSDTIVMKTLGNKLILAGGRPRGTVYAVYSFLEDNLGCNWWDQNNSSIPVNRNIAIKALNKVYTPTVTYRSVWYKYIEYEQGPFGARLKLNGTIPQPAAKYGGHIRPILSGHSLHYVLPPDTYFASHPEWYGLYDGTRCAILPGGHKNQLCLSNNEMRQEFINRMLQLIQGDPNAEVISIGQQDGASPCSCAPCQAMNTTYGGPSGTQLTFVNQCADAVKAVYPKIRVETLAYQWSINPPTAAPTGLLARRDNVNVRIAPINEDFGAPWNSKRNTRVSELVQGWKSFANIAVYDYSVNYHQPFILLPAWNTLGANIRYYANNKVKSIVYHGEISNDGANFCRLRAWLIAHLIWDPSSDQNALTMRFLNGYYGAAGPYLKQYIDLTQRAASENTTFMPIWSDDPCFLTSAQLQSAKSYFDSAEAAVANDPVLLNRVKIERLGFDHQLLLSRLVMPEVQSWVSESYRDTLATNFIALSKSSDNYFTGEKIPMPSDYYDILTGRKEVTLSKDTIPTTRKPANVPTKVTQLNLPVTDWSDIQESQFLLTPSNREIISDPLSSNAAGIKLPGGVYDWILQAPVFSRNCMNSSVDLYVTAKINTSKSSGLAFKIVVYDLPSGTFPLERWVNISEFSGSSGYKEIKIGSFIPSEKHVIICTPNSGDDVADFTVDRFFFIKKI